MLEYLAPAALLGLAGGFGPGPLLALVISETLNRGIGAGIRVAVAPLLTDAPIIALSLLVISRLESSAWLLGAISLAGGMVVLRIGLHDLRRGAHDVDADAPQAPSRSLRRGVIVNLLNPHPYVFWFSVGAPLIVRAAQTAAGLAVAFMVVFYGLLVGSKVLVAWIAARSRAFLRGRSFDMTIRALGVLMILFSFLLLRDGVALIVSAL